jgi:hypothetical protein
MEKAWEVQKAAMQEPTRDSKVRMQDSAYPPRLAVVSTAFQRVSSSYRFQDGGEA